MADRVALLVVADLLARSRLEEAAAAEGVTVVSVRRLAAAGSESPSLVIVDLDAPGALDDVEAWRASHADVPVVGFVSHVDVETRRAAEGLGVRVITRGQTASMGRELFRA